MVDIGAFNFVYLTVIVIPAVARYTDRQIFVARRIGKAVDRTVPRCLTKIIYSDIQGGVARCIDLFLCQLTVSI